MILATLLMLSSEIIESNSYAVHGSSEYFIARLYSLVSALRIKYFNVHMPLTSLLKTCPTFLLLAFVLLSGMALNRLSLQ